MCYTFVEEGVKKAILPPLSDPCAAVRGNATIRGRSTGRFTPADVSENHRLPASFILKVTTRRAQVAFRDKVESQLLHVFSIKKSTE